MKIALALIANGIDSEIAPLKECLTDIENDIDQVFVTITHKQGEQPSKAMEEMLDGFTFADGKPVVSHYEWTYDFANARNFNFAQVPKEYEYILWLDADDGMRNLHLLKPAILRHPDIDAFTFNYMYAFDEHKNPVVVHLKTQVVKNDGCVIWRGQLHEDFEPTRELKTFLIQGIERIHLSDEKRFDAAKFRNLEVAQKNLDKDPNDPRSWWNLGQSLRALNEYQKAIDTFSTFLDKSQSDEEKYIVRLRRAECYWGLGQHNKGIDECRYAIGTRPEYPDAYHLLGSLYLETQQYEQSAKMYLEGLVKKPPYTKILVYNPRDYDYTPLKNLAKAFYAMSRPDDALICLKQCLEVIPGDTDTQKLIKIMEAEKEVFDKVVEQIANISKMKDKEAMRKAIDDLPNDVRSHPAVCNLRNVNFIKETSSGKDVVFYCGMTNEIWNPDTARVKGIGGSEEAVIWLSKLLQARGLNVTVYANMGSEDKTFDGVQWKPYWSWNYRDKQDVVVIWRHPQLAKYEINAPKVIVDMHDVVKEGEFTPDRLARITKIFVKSEFHRSLFPNIPDEKFKIMPNGIDSGLFKAKQLIERDPMLMVNTSSADRSLEALLDCYEEIKKQVPEAKLQWAYGWGVWDFTHASNADRMSWKTKMQERMKELGVEELGRVSHAKVAGLYLKANIFGYPSEFAEIDCISLSKAMAAGAIPVTTDFAAMGEKEGHGGVFIGSGKTKDTWAKPYQFHFEMQSDAQKRIFVEQCVKILKNPPSEEEREAMRTWAQDTYSWHEIADRWFEALTNA